jgi:hypothetical protein
MWLLIVTRPNHNISRRYCPDASLAAFPAGKLAQAGGLGQADCGPSSATLSGYQRGRECHS